jgi:hypothetical protein
MTSLFSHSVWVGLDANKNMEAIQGSTWYTGRKQYNCMMWWDSALNVPRFGAGHDLGARLVNRAADILTASRIRLQQFYLCNEATLTVKLMGHKTRRPMII